jgi:hypothetical protein
MANVVSIKAWSTDMTEDEQLAANARIQVESINLLKTVGLEFHPRGGEFSGKDFQAVPLLDQARFRKEYCGTARMTECTIKFEATDGCEGMCFFFGSHTGHLVVKKVTGAGRVSGDQRAPKAPKVLKAIDQWEYTIGQMYGGSGFFTDPDNHEVEETGPPRMFLTPLCGLAISVQFHPTHKQLVLENQRLFPAIIAYRVDGLFCTSFSASWQVGYRF